ncbi:hypothetical protein EYC84_003317 [Monilinia fructicola]|uniref:Uncharacterized protein n=1 Tax=Monilinia fructicola TaxID=38448 RepID=A0A5M9JU47_MONFR|nr:hypothetical protein EYC84_003317 [Monilinia fructicola]
MKHMMREWRAFGAYRVSNEMKLKFFLWISFRPWFTSAPATSNPNVELIHSASKTAIPLAQHPPSISCK